MFDFLHILSWLLFIPLIAAFATLAMDTKVVRVATNARWVSLFSSGFTLVISLYCLYQHMRTGSPISFHESYNFATVPGLDLTLAADSLSFTMIVLMNVLFFIVYFIGEVEFIRYREYLVLLNITQAVLIAFFSCRNILLFYILFEAALIPMFFIIGIWGGKEKIYAAFKFFAMTFIFSLGFLIAILSLYNSYQSLDFVILKSLMAQTSPPKWIWWAFFLAFAVKVPVLFLHNWLPHAHVEAPTTASMILAGILLKLGGYGFIRFNLDLLPYLTFEFNGFVQVLSIVGILYAALVALAQTDMKRMVAYASVSHMGFVTLGLFNLNNNGLAGSIFQMVSHGIISAALFMAVGILYRRLHTREICDFQGLAQRMPLLVGCMGVYLFALLGLPGTSGFVGEFMIYMSTAEVNYFYVFLIAISGVITAGYSLNFLKRLAFGAEELPAHFTQDSLSARENISLIVMASLIVFLGLFPNIVLNFNQNFVKMVSVEYRALPDQEDPHV